MDLCWQVTKCPSFSSIKDKCRTMLPVLPNCIGCDEAAGHDCGLAVAWGIKAKYHTNLSAVSMEVHLDQWWWTLCLPQCLFMGFSGSAWFIWFVSFPSRCWCVFWLFVWLCVTCGCCGFGLFASQCGFYVYASVLSLYVCRGYSTGWDGVVFTERVPAEPGSLTFAFQNHH